MSGQTFRKLNIPLKICILLKNNCSCDINLSFKRPSNSCPSILRYTESWVGIKVQHLQLQLCSSMQWNTMYHQLHLLTIFRFFIQIWKATSADYHSSYCCLACSWWKWHCTCMRAPASFAPARKSTPITCNYCYHLSRDYPGKICLWLLLAIRIMAHRCFCMGMLCVCVWGCKGLVSGDLLMLR